MSRPIISAARGQVLGDPAGIEILSRWPGVTPASAENMILVRFSSFQRGVSRDDIYSTRSREVAADNCHGEPERERIRKLYRTVLKESPS